MRPIPTLTTTLWIAALSFLPLTVFAQGQIFVNPPQPGRVVPPLPTKQQAIGVKITDQVAVTEIDQTFTNQTAQRLEGTYIFPVPKGVSLSKLTMEIDGEPVTAKVEKAQEARRTYENIVRQQRDPALLEYIDRDLVRLRVYPIEPNADTRIVVRYEEILAYDGGVSRYRFGFMRPSGSARVPSGEKVSSVRVKVELETRDELKSLYSPTHDVSVKNKNDHGAVIRFSDEDVTHERDFELVYGVSPGDVAMHLLSYRDDDDEDGYFMLLASPREGLEDEDRVAKRVVFAIDTSGSMRVRKIDQAKNALKFCLQGLDKNDRFGLITFSDEIVKHSEELLAAKRGEIEKAVDHVDDLEANGGTNIDEALEEALQMLDDDDDSPAYLLFLTDGKPTVGVTQPEKILEHVGEENDATARVFSFGVGFDVNTQLLDRLATEQRGVVSYVRPEEDIEVAVSSLFGKISSPVLTDPEIDFGDAEVSKVYPKELPDIFAGQQLVVLGRYEDGGNTKLQLAGKTQKKKQSYKTSAVFAEESDDYDFIPRLWASRRIGYLAEQLQSDSQNEELIGEIVKLSKEFGIVTPWTSMLITDDMPGMRRELSMGQLRSSRSTSRVSPRSGEVQFSFLSGAADAAGRARSGATMDVTRNIDLRAFGMGMSGGVAKYPAPQPFDVERNGDPRVIGSLPERKAESLQTVPDAVGNGLQTVLDSGVATENLAPSISSTGHEVSLVTFAWRHGDSFGVDGARPVPDTGAAAVGRSLTVQSQLKRAEQVGDALVFYDTQGQRQTVQGVRQAGKNTFYQVGMAWVQDGFDFKVKDDALTRIKPYSKAYFDLVLAIPDLAKVFSLGDTIYLHHRGHQIVIAQDGLEEVTSELLKKLQKPA